MKEKTKTELHSLLYLKKEEILTDLDSVILRRVLNNDTESDYIISAAMLRLKALIEVDELINKLEKF